MIRARKITFDIDDNGCFNCTSHKQTRSGYTMVKFSAKRDYLHRIVYRECFGEIPDGLLIRHTCDNPRCINPEHLKVGTHFQNTQDSVKRGRNAFGEKSGSAKLSEKEVREIIRRLSDGEMQTKIARDYGVHKTTITYINNGKNWSHIKR